MGIRYGATSGFPSYRAPAGSFKMWPVAESAHRGFIFECRNLVPKLLDRTCGVAIGSDVDRYCHPSLYGFLQLWLRVRGLQRVIGESPAVDRTLPVQLQKHLCVAPTDAMGQKRTTVGWSSGWKRTLSDSFLEEPFLSPECQSSRESILARR